MKTPAVQSTLELYEWKVCMDTQLIDSRRELCEISRALYHSATQLVYSGRAFWEWSILFAVLRSPSPL